MLPVAGMKVICNLLDGQNIQILRSLSIQSEAQLFHVPSLGQIKVNDLAIGMDTSICPPSPVNRDSLAAVQSKKCFFQFFLDRPLLGLALEASKEGTIIGNCRLISNHVTIVA